MAYVVYLLAINSRRSVQDASPPFTAPKRYVMSHIAWKSESLKAADAGGSVKSRIGKSGDLARMVIRLSAKKTR